MTDTWDDGSVYERYMGRWSRRMAAAFVAWLEAEPQQRWLDVGCGNGALSEALLEGVDPVELHAVDLSPGFVEAATRRLPALARVQVADGQDLPFPDGRFDHAVSGIALNFFPDPGLGIRELARVVEPGGTVAAFVWDYADGMEMIRVFWDAAVALHPAALELDEAERFPICHLDRITDLAGRHLDDVEGTVLTIPTTFADFDDFWSPFLGGQGPAPSYVATLSAADRETLRAELRRHLGDGPIEMQAKAIAFRGSARG